MLTLLDNLFLDLLGGISLCESHRFGSPQLLLMFLLCLLLGLRCFFLLLLFCLQATHESNSTLQGQALS